MKNILRNTLYIVLVAFITSCNNEPKREVIVCTYKTLIAKTIEYDENWTYYKFAFNDGTTKNTTFGYYSCLVIGDSVQFCKELDESDYYYKMNANCN